MKSWILLFVMSAAAIEVLGLSTNRMIEECSKEVKFNLDEFIADRSGKPSNDPAVKCFYACVAKKTGWMTKNGDVIQDKLLSRPISEIPEEHRPTVMHILQTCVKIGENECETASFVFKCLENYTKKPQ